MSQEYTLLALASLEPGSWADWFSGSMSALAVAVALSAYPISNWQKRRDDRERDRERGRAIGYKLWTLLNQNADIDRHIKTSFASRVRRFPANMRFPRVRPLGVSERKPAELNQAEIDLLLKSQSAELLMELELCFGRFSSITYGMAEYKNRHESLYELMPVPITSEGMTFTHSLTAEESARVMPYAKMLDSLLESTINLLEINSEKLRWCLSQYDKDMTRYFEKPPLTLVAESPAPPAESEPAS